MKAALFSSSSPSKQNFSATIAFGGRWLARCLATDALDAEPQPAINESPVQFQLVAHCPTFKTSHCGLLVDYVEQQYLHITYRQIETVLNHSPFTKHSGSMSWAGEKTPPSVALSSTHAPQDSKRMSTAQRRR